MSSGKIIRYIKLHKLKVFLITLGVCILLSIITLTTVGLQAFFQMESFYRRQMFAGIPLQMFFYLVIGTVSAAISTCIFVYFVWGGGFQKLGRKKAKPEKVNVKWSDVIGMDAVKKEVQEVVALINDKTRLKSAGGKIIKGVLMVGPPGCGKTYLAKAIATETKLPFLHASGSDFQGVFIGVGTSRIRSLFKEARILAELDGGCIIFLDEVDTIAKPRMSESTSRGGQDYNATINQLLTELDGLASVKDNIVVLAATNSSEFELDSALMRPGRFDRKIYIGLPGLEDRKKIIKYYLSKVQHDSKNVNIEKIARLTVNNTPADIANIVREASLVASRKKKKQADMEDISEARERIALGIKSQISLSENDKLIAAYHEGGHTMVTYLLVPTQDVFKASIIPRRGISGATWIIGKEEHQIPSKEELLGEIKILLGGYAAEKIKFGSTSAGVGDDLSKANSLARKMVTAWGMGTSGPAGVSSDKFFHRDISERDKEDIILKCLNEINDVLRREKNILEDIAQQLLKKEELDYDELESIFKKHGKTRLTYACQDKTDAEKKITWDDIIGMDEVKEEAKEVVNLIKDRVAVQEVGGHIIKGLLLFGPPGCGKTYLASVMASEAGVPFIAKSGSEFVEMFVGVGASRIRHLFQEARDQALAKGGCIIFIDELDALGAKRGMNAGFGGTTEHNQTLNQFLVEMDGLKEKDAPYNIVVIGATNMDEQHMDQAVLRPGRFDRKIYVELPTFDERKKLFEYYLNKIEYNSKNIIPEKFAGITPGYSPADIANLVKEGSLLAARNKSKIVDIKELDEARERIELGLKRKLKLTKGELKATAYHEAGHCLAEYFFGKGTFPFKLSIIPRKGTLGVAWYATKSDSSAGSKDELLYKINIFLGGYAAEKITNQTTNGVSQDFTVAMSIAHSMVWKWGMGNSGFIGNFLFSKNSHHLLSETMKTKLDVETQEILQGCLKEAEKLLKHERILFEHLAEELVRKEELNSVELEGLFKQYVKKNLQQNSS